MWNLKYDTNEPIYETETLTNIENKLTVIKEESRGEREIRRLTLTLHIHTTTYKIDV